MAIDSEAKRKSAANTRWSGALINILPPADGSISSGDRLALTGLYSGLAAAETVFIATLDVSISQPLGINSSIDQPLGITGSMSTAED